MEQKSLNSLVGAGLVTLALFAVITSARAQSADALINKLVEKGILTTKEPSELRDETQKDFDKSFRKETGMPDWITGFKVSGDFRGRFEENNAENTLYHTRDRYRYRVRAGLTVSLANSF